MVPAVAMEEKPRCSLNCELEEAKTEFTGHNSRKERNTQKKNSRALRVSSKVLTSACVSVNCPGKGGKAI